MADNKRTRKYDNLHKNPDYAVVCSFLGKFNSLLNSPDITFENLERWISEQRPICNTFKDFLLSLLKRWRSSANDERFSKYLLKFCESYSHSDAAELEKFGFEKCSMDLKLRLVKNLVEQQFDTNLKFKDKVNMISADELRVQPIGRDIKGKTYWSFMDYDMNLRIFSGETPAMGTDFKQKWEIIARNRMELSELISSLQNSDLTVEKLSSNNNNTNNNDNNHSDGDDVEQKLDAELKVNVEGDDIKNDVKESVEEGVVSVKKEMDFSTTDCENKAIVSVSTSPSDNGEADDNTGNQDDNTGNQDDNTGNQDDNTGNQDDNTGNQDGNTGNQDNEKEMSTNYCEANGDDTNYTEKNITSTPTREGLVTELCKEDENAIGSPVPDNQNECSNVDFDDKKVDVLQNVSDDKVLDLELRATCSHSDTEAKDLKKPSDDGSKTSNDGKELNETEEKGSVNDGCDLNPSESTSDEPDVDLQVSSLDVVGVIYKKENADQKQDTESLLKEEPTFAEVVKSCEVAKPAVNASEGSKSPTEVDRCQSEDSSTQGDTKQRDSSSLDGLSIAFVEPAAPTSSGKCSRQGFRILTKRKRDFMSSARSNFLHGRRKGISDSELSESSNDSNPEDSGAQSSAPEDGPPLKRQRNKALINRSRRNILHCRPFKIKDKHAPERSPENSVAIHSSIQVAVPSGDALLNGVQHSPVDDTECQTVNRAEDSKAEKEGIMVENDSKECSIPTQDQQVIEEHDSISKISESTKEVEVNVAIPPAGHAEDEPTGDGDIRGEPAVADNPLSPQDRKNVNTDENLNSSIVEHHTSEEKETSQSEISTMETEAVKGSPEFSDVQELEAEGKVSPKMEENVEPVLLNDQTPIGSPANRENSQGNIDGEKMIDVDKNHTHQSPEERDHEKMTDLSVNCATKRSPDGEVVRIEDDGQSVDKDEISSDSSEPVAPKKRCDDFDHLSMIPSQSGETGGQGQKDEPVFLSNDKQMETFPSEGSNESKDSKDPETALPSNSPISDNSEKGEPKVETSRISQESPEDEKKAEEGRKKSKKVNGCGEEGSADFVELRRSSRVNKGQRKVEMLELEFPSRRRKKKEEMTEEEREKKQAEKERRRTEKMMRQMAEEYEELLQAKKDKKKRFKLVNDDDDDDEDFIPGTRKSLRGKRKKRNDDDDDDDDDDDEDDDSFSDVDDDGDDCTLGTQSSTSDEELLILESDGSVYEPTGRNARRVACLRSELESESKNQSSLVDQQCLICNKKSEPEFMLLCDKCDDGYHTWCLRPPLHIIPDGDWFCPPCEHKMLLERLQEQLCEFDEKAKLNIKLTNRKERLAFVNISLNNILMEKDMEELSEKLQETQSRHLASSSGDDNDDRDNDKYSADDDDDADFCNLQNGGKKSKVKEKKLLSTDSEESVASCSLKADDKDGDDDDVGRNLMQNRKPKKRNRLASSSESDSVTDFHDDDEDGDDLPDKLPKKKKSKCQKKSDDDDDDDDNDDNDDSNDEVNHRKKTKKRRFYMSDEYDDGDDDEEEDEVEGNWLVTRRSRRQRKEISYKFEEYENLISGAIEDDVKETYGAGNYGRGKDMANITGAKNNSSNSPAGNGKRRRKKKKFSILDSDDEGGDNDDDDDDSEEFKIDDDDASVDEDDDEDAATEIDQSEIEEGEVESSRGRKGKLADLSSRKSKRSKKRSRVYDDYIIEEDLLLDSKALKRPPARRAAARKGINYNEYTDEENDDESSAKRQKNSEDSKRESPSSVKCNLKDGKSRKKRSRDEDGDEDYLEDEDDEYEEEDFTPGCRDSYSDDDLRDFIKSGSSTTSECSSSPSHKANKKNKSLMKSQKKKKVAPSSSGGGSKRRRKSAGGNNSSANKKKGKKTKKKKRKPWYSSDSDEVDEDEASVTRDSYSDDDFVSYTMTAPQKRTGRRALTYKDEQENPTEKSSVSAPVSSADVSVQSSVPLLMKGVTSEAHVTANQPQAVHSLQPISIVPQVTATQKIVSPVPQVTVANQRLNSPRPLTTLTGQRITSPHPLQVSAIGQRVASPNFHITPASMVQTIVTTASVLGSSVPRFALRDSQATDLSCNVPLPALQAITAQRVSSYNPHIATGGQRLLSQDPFTFSGAAHHFPGASTTTVSDPRGMPPLPPLYPIIKNNYLINAPVAMAMRSGMTSFGGICSIAPPPLSQGQKMAEEQVMVNHPFNEKLSSFSVRNITSVAPRIFKPPYGVNLQNAPTEEDFLVQDLDITEFLNPDHANL